MGHGISRIILKIIENLNVSPSFTLSKYDKVKYHTLQEFH